MSDCQKFFYMSGYAIYVWSAYLLMLLVLGVQWYVPWRKLKKHRRKEKERVIIHESHT